MTHQGRIHIISSAAEETSKKILTRIQKKSPKTQKGLRRPLWTQIEFLGTAEELQLLANAAMDYKARVPTENTLIAHGTSDCSTLCQILLDGELRHIKGIENYGDLSTHDGNTLVGGYWNHGWGIFVTTPGTIQKCDERCTDKKFLIVRLKSLRTILLPTPLVEILKEEFPDHAHLIKGYQQFARELGS